MLAKKTRYGAFAVQRSNLNHTIVEMRHESASLSKGVVYLLSS